MAAPERILFHSNAQVGDYAVSTSFTHSSALINPESVSKSRLEVTGKENDLFIVTMHFLEAHPKAMENYGFEYAVDRNGSVKKAFLLKGKGSKVSKTPINIARKNETGYVDYTDLKVAANIKNSRQSFPGATLIEADSFVGDANNNSKTVTYYAVHAEVPFQVIYGRTNIEMQMVSSSTSQIGNIRTTMYTKETESMSTVTKLIETGNVVNKTSIVYADDYVLTE